MEGINGGGKTEIKYTPKSFPIVKFSIEEFIHFSGPKIKWINPPAIYSAEW